MRHKKKIMEIEVYYNPLGQIVLAQSRPFHHDDDIIVFTPEQADAIVGFIQETKKEILEIDKQDPEFFAFDNEDLNKREAENEDKIKQQPEGKQIKLNIK
jgi:hypothetical protein